MRPNSRKVGLKLSKSNKDGNEKYELWKKKYIENQPLCIIAVLLIIGGMLFAYAPIAITGAILLATTLTYKIASSMKGKRTLWIIVAILSVGTISYGFYAHSHAANNREIREADEARRLIESMSTTGGTGLPPKAQSFNEEVWQDPEITVSQGKSPLLLTTPDARKPIRFSISGGKFVKKIAAVKAFLRETFDPGSIIRKVSPNQIDIEQTSFVINPESKLWGVYSIAGTVSIEGMDGIVHEVAFVSGTHREYRGAELEELILKSLPKAFRNGRIERRGLEMMFDGSAGKSRATFESPLTVTRALTFAVKIKVETLPDIKRHHIAIDFSMSDGNFVGLRGVQRDLIGGLSAGGRLMRFDLGRAVEQEMIIWITSDGKGEYSIEFPESQSSVFQKNMQCNDWSRLLGIEVQGAICYVESIEIGTAEESVAKPQRQYSLTSISSELISILRKKNP